MFSKSNRPDFLPLVNFGLLVWAVGNQAGGGIPGRIDLIGTSVVCALGFAWFVRNLFSREEP